MKHMIPLLIGSFILVNVLSGYLNADPTLASTTIARFEIKKPIDRLQALGAAKSMIRQDHID